ncbi:hypothetical protein C8F01DRAFT_657735 [Mycena amicta]|nr:hypothetical protein C8F01DRAFT_657735 [Mycena amicta]
MDNPISDSVYQLITSAPPLYLPEISDAAWDNARASTDSELAAKRADGFFLIASLNAALLGALADQDSCASDIREQLQEDILIEPIITLLLEKAGVYSHHPDEKHVERERQAYKAFAIFTEMAVADRGLEEFTGWFKEVFTPILSVIVEEFIQQRAPQPTLKRKLPASIGREWKRRKTDFSSTDNRVASALDILLRLRHRQALLRFFPTSTVVIALKPGTIKPPVTQFPIYPPKTLSALQNSTRASSSVSSLDQTSLENLSEPSSQSTANESVTILSPQPTLAPEMIEPATHLAPQQTEIAPAATDDLLQEADRFIGETIEMHRRGEIKPLVQMETTDTTTTTPIKPVPEPKANSNNTKASAQKDRQRNASSGKKKGKKKAQKAEQPPPRNNPAPLSGGGMANSGESSQPSPQPEQPFLESFEAPRYDDVPAKWFWPNAPTYVFSNPLVAVMPPSFYWT